MDAAADASDFVDDDWAVVIVEEEDRYPDLFGALLSRALCRSSGSAPTARPCLWPPLPLAAADRFPVSLENTSRMRPANLLTAPSALSRRPDLVS